MYSPSDGVHVDRMLEMTSYFHNYATLQNAKHPRQKGHSTNRSSGQSASIQRKQTGFVGCGHSGISTLSVDCHKSMQNAKHMIQITLMAEWLDRQMNQSCKALKRWFGFLQTQRKQHSFREKQSDKKGFSRTGYGSLTKPPAFENTARLSPTIRDLVESNKMVPHCNFPFQWTVSQQFRLLILL